MTFDKLWQILEAMRDEIQAEHGLISHRMNWCAISQSFLMTAYAIAWGTDHRNSFEDFFRYAIPISGLALSILACAAISAGIIVQSNLIDEQGRLIEALEKAVKDDEQQSQLAVYKKITCFGRKSGKSLHWMSMIPVLLILIIFFFLWCWAWSAGQHPRWQTSSP